MIHQFQHYTKGAKSPPQFQQTHPAEAVVGAHEALVSRPDRPDIADRLALAHEAAKAASAWAYRRSYTTGVHTIACREPTAHTRHLSEFHSWDYAKAAGVTTTTALRHLRSLVTAGHLIEPKRNSGVRRFRVPDDVGDRFGREQIAALLAEGLPFDDDYKRALQAEREAVRA